MVQFESHRIRGKRRSNSPNGFVWPADIQFLRSVHPAETAIAKVFAKVFAKIRQKILFCKFFGRTGTSRTTSCQNFSLERPLAVPKTSKKREKKSELFTMSELSFSSFLIDFGGARLFLTSNSSSSRFFALDGQIFRSVRRLELIFGLFTVCTSTLGPPARDDK